MPEAAAEWDRRLDGTIKAAQAEALSAGNPALADMLSEFRLAMGQWREISMSRLRAMGLHGLSEQEYAAVLKLVAEAVAHETVQEARIQVESRRDTWWSKTSVRVGVIAAVVGLLLSSMGTLAAVLTFLLRGPHP